LLLRRFADTTIYRRTCPVRGPSVTQSASEVPPVSGALWLPSRVWHHALVRSNRQAGAGASTQVRAAQGPEQRHNQNHRVRRLPKERYQDMTISRNTCEGELSPLKEAGVETVKRCQVRRLFKKNITLGASNAGLQKQCYFLLLLEVPRKDTGGG